MKFIRNLLFSLMFVPMVAGAASNDFMAAAQLLAAAKNADVQQVQALINNGANVNFVDSTGLSIVCTALMNNDVRAAQILQMYGADASQCDRQIKRYNSRTKPKTDSGGLFSGLSSAQSLSLAAAGAAVVIGGLFLLTDVFDPGNDNESAGSGSGNRPGGGGSSGEDTGTEAFALAYGPAMPNAESETKNYSANLDFYSENSTESDNQKANFALMNANGQNYMLIMHGYSPLARGYLGMQTLRNAAREPFDLSGLNWRNEPVMGGKPVNVAIVTKNGINANTYKYGVDATSSLGDTLLPWTTVNGTQVSPAGDSMVANKYYNNAVVLGSGATTVSEAVTQEDDALLTKFDLAGYGTAVHNPMATTLDNMLAKVVGGRISGYSAADYIGFMPNGQMTIFRTGNGARFVNATNEGTGTYAETDGVLSSITLFGKDLDVTMGANNSFVAQYSETTTDDEGQETTVVTKYTGYIGTNGLLYIDSGADGEINQAYKMANNNLTLTKELGAADYYNYTALSNAADLGQTGSRSSPVVLANAAVIEPLHDKSVETIEDVLAMPEDEQDAALFTYINKYYENADDDSSPQGAAAKTLYGKLGSTVNSILVFSTGAAKYQDNTYGAALGATFENVVPLLYENAEHLFMSVVAVNLGGDGTKNTESVSGYAPKSKIALSQWSVTDGENKDYYQSRVCGIAGTGMGAVDPWCFAAAGVTDELAVVSAAGAVGAIKGAFPYLNDNRDVFNLLALTADGPYLATGSDGKAISKENLVSYLQSMYSLPQNYQTRVDNGADYLDVFAEVFGYGLINLERATTPGTKVYYYDGKNIVSADNTAYWRAASNTMFRPSSALNVRGATIAAPFYDVLESVDGTLSMPRVWENSFAMGGDASRALYMGDVLGDLDTRRDSTQHTQIGKIGFSMALSERAYVDNMNGLDNMKLSYSNDKWSLSASYQRYFTDGASRFDGLANPVLGLATNVVDSAVKYKSGDWSFGARAFSGMITDEGLLENDPTISAQYMPAKLGLMQGAESSVGWSNKDLMFTAAIGNARESDTVLGAQSGGLLNIGAGDTTYVDLLAKYKMSDSVALTGRATFARTVSDANGEFILGMGDIHSNAFAFGLQIGNFDFGVSQPLAIRSGALQYAHAEYDVIQVADGKYELNVVDTHVADLALRPEKRETRFNATYRHNFGEFTDGALGFIYRVNPNHMDDFGNESIFMMKMTHRLGI